MKLFRSALVLLLAFVMLLSIVACGNDKPVVDDDFFTDSKESISNGETSNDKQPSGSGNQNTAGGKTWKELLASMPEKLRGTTVTFFNWNPPSEYTGATTVMNNFTKETGIKIEWVTQDYDTYLTKLASMVASDTAPDFARTRGPLVANMQSFQPLSAAKFDFTDAAWDKDVMKDYSIKDKAYATSLNNTHLGSMSVMFYNKALIDKYDYEDPYKLWKDGKWTWDKFLDMTKEFKKDAGTEFGAGAWEWSGLSLIFGVGGPYEYDGTKYRSVLNESKFISVTQELADLYNTDNLIHEYGSGEFDRGELLFWSGFSIYGRRLNSYFSTLKRAGTLYAVPLPSVDGQKVYYQGRNEYEAYALVKGAKNPEAVPYFLRYFLNPDNYDLDAFWTNGQMAEVYNWCMSQPTKIWTVDYWNKQDQMGFDRIKKVKGNQVKNFVDSYGNQVIQRVNELNAIIDKF